MRVAIRRGIRVAQGALRVGLLLTTLLLSSCFSIDIVNPEEPVSILPDRSSAIHPGQSDRAAVRGLLGEPLLASSPLRFDLFREDATQSLVPIVLTPWPVPFGYMEDELLRYTLVAYDGSGKVAALASGIFSKPTEFRRISPIESQHSALHLRVGDLMFFVDPEGERRENLLIAPAGRDAVLQDARSPSACTVVMGCGDRGCPDRLAVDGGPAQRLPLRIVQVYWLKAGSREAWMAGTSASGSGPLAWLESLMARQFAPGTHALKFSSKFLGGEHEISLACRAGEVSYLLVDARDDERFFNRSLVDWQLRRLDAMPHSFAMRPLVILYEGQWLNATVPAR